MRLRDLLSVIDGDYRLVGASNLDIDIQSITDDSKQATPFSLFVAHQGTHNDGHLFVKDAVLKGASCVLVEKEIFLNVPQVVVPSTRGVSWKLAKKLYGDPSSSLVMCAITGTNGKTTTAFCMEQLFLSAGHQVGLLGTITYRDPVQTWPSSLTTPGAIQLQQLLFTMKSHGVSAIAMEVSSHALVQGRIRGILYDVAGFTNLSQDHLDFHVTMEDYFLAKRILFLEYLRPVAWSVICLDGEYGLRLYRELKEMGRKVMGVSVKKHPWADVWVKSKKSSILGTQVVFESKQGELAIHSCLIGEHNVENLAVAVGMALCLGMDTQTITHGLEKLYGIPGRLQRIGAQLNETTLDSSQGPYVFVDYAHTPDALSRVLTTMKSLKPKDSRIWIVFGCGGDRDETKRPLMGQQAGLHGDVVVITNDNPRSEDPRVIAQQVEKGVSQYKNRFDRGDKIIEPISGYCVLLDRMQAIQWAILNAAPTDVVLIAGKGHETYQHIGQEKHPFSDEEVSMSAILERQKGHTP